LEPHPVFSAFIGAAYKEKKLLFAPLEEKSALSGESNKIRSEPLKKNISK
jgi:hypothetical protein